MQRIKRNATYYAVGSQQNCWCEKCYLKLRDNEGLMLDDGSETKKARLQRAKHDSLPEETWAQCEGCKCRVHQICALTNDRIRKINSTFLCPKCDLKNRQYPEQTAKYTSHARDLQKCKMSDSMEEGLQKTLAAAYEAKANELGVSIDEVDKAEGLSIRVLSHIEKKHTIRDEVSLFCECVMYIYAILAELCRLFRCIKCTPRLAVHRTFLSTRSVLAFSSPSTASTCCCLQCTSTSTGTTVLHRIEEKYTFRTLIRFNILNPAFFAHQPISR
jgi:hypothetical protein